jgi:hypothetical protein
MSCERYRDALTDAAAGEAPASALEHHLVACEECRSDLARLRQALAAADASLAELALTEPSPALRARIREAVAGRPAEPALRFRLTWPLAAAAVVAVAAFGVWRTGTFRGPGRPAATRSTTSPAVVGNERGRGVAPSTAPASGAALQVAVPAASVAASAGSNGSTPAPPPARRPSSVRSTPVRTARAAFPEVIVPPDGEEALLRFVALVHRDRFYAPALAAAGTASCELAEPEDIEIPPLEIAPLEEATAGSGT